MTVAEYLAEGGCDGECTGEELNHLRGLDNMHERV